jgi:putative addiction module component (TIGR02574 family)
MIDTMSVVSEAETIEQALKLSDASRAQLAEKLIASLPAPFVDEDEDWVEEALRRDREMDENPDSVMSEEEFFASLRDYIK